MTTNKHLLIAMIEDVVDHRLDVLCLISTTGECPTADRIRVDHLEVEARCALLPLWNLPAPQGRQGPPNKPGDDLVDQTHAIPLVRTEWQ